MPRNADIAALLREYEEWLSEMEIFHLEKALKMSKLPACEIEMNRQRSMATAFSMCQFKLQHELSEFAPRKRRGLLATIFGV